MINLTIAFVSGFYLGFYLPRLFNRYVLTPPYDEIKGFGKKIKGE